MKDFNKFMSQLQETNQTLDFFCDFDKIAANVDNIRLSLCMLNSMIGTADLRKSVETIWNRDRTAFSVMDILIAVRSEGKKAVLNSAGQCIILDKFSGCKSLTCINIPNSVTTIGMDAFENCKSLTNINIPNSVTTIEDGAFYGCENLPSHIKSDIRQRFDEKVFDLW